MGFGTRFMKRDESLEAVAPASLAGNVDEADILQPRQAEGLDLVGLGVRTAVVAGHDVV